MKLIDFAVDNIRNKHRTKERIITCDCPYQYLKGMLKKGINFEEMCAGDKCEKCWNQEYIELKE